MAQATKKAGSTPPKDVMGFLEYYLVTKAPFALSPGLKEWIVQYAPWINLVLLILFAPAILLALGIGTITLPFSAATGEASGLTLSLIAHVVQVGLMIAALPGLFNRKKPGWNFAFYGVVASLVYSLLNVAIVSGIIGALISSYILFQIKSYYK